MCVRHVEKGLDFLQLDTSQCKGVEYPLNILDQLSSRRSLGTRDAK